MSDTYTNIIECGDCLYHRRDTPPVIDGFYVQTNWHEFLLVRWVGKIPLNNQEQAMNISKYPYFTRLFP